MLSSAAVIRVNGFICQKISLIYKVNVGPDAISTLNYKSVEVLCPNFSLVDTKKKKTLKLVLAAPSLGVQH